MIPSKSSSRKPRNPHDPFFSLNPNTRSIPNFCHIYLKIYLEIVYSSISLSPDASPFRSGCSMRLPAPQRSSRMWTRWCHYALKILPRLPLHLRSHFLPLLTCSCFLMSSPLLSSLTPTFPPCFSHWFLNCVNLFLQDTLHGFPLISPRPSPS